MTMDIIPFPPVTPSDAVAAGYAEFNYQPHLCIDVPDGGFTITTRTSEGKRVTFAFQPYKSGGAPQCVDITFHDNGTTRFNGNRELPTFDAILFGQTDAPAVPFQYDSRKQPFKPGIVCVLMDGRG